MLVTDAGLGSALAIIQSLGRAGYRVVAADSDPRSPGLRSRYARVRVCYPDVEHDAPAFAARLVELVREHGVDLVIPVTDRVIRALLPVRSVLERRTRLAMPEARALEVVTEKAKTMELARSLGIPVPETRIVDSTEQALAAAPRLGWPLVLKPQSSSRMTERGVTRRVESFDVTYAASEEELAEKMRRFEGRGSVLLQRYCEGVGTGVELLLWEGRPLAAFQHRRLREIPPTGGASALRESEPLDPQLYDWSCRLLAELRFSGLVMVEWKRGERTELMEINGRVWGSLPLATASGIDFPARLVRLLLEGEAEPAGDPLCRYRVGVRSRDLGRDLLWIGSVLSQVRRHAFLPLPARREAWRALLQLFDPRVRTDGFMWDDPLPALCSLRQLAPKLWRKVGSRRAEDVPA